MQLKEVLDFLHEILGDQQFTNIQETVFSRAWEGLTYPEIAEEAGYDTEYIKHVGFQVWQLLSQSLGTKVSKHNFRAVINRYAGREDRLAELRNMGMLHPEPKIENIAPSLESPELALQGQQLSHPAIAVNLSPHHIDWGEAINVANFYGRAQELATLSQWILGENCSLVAILGMGGVGKTALSVKLAQQLQDKFDYVVWRSLRNAPHLADLLTDLLGFIGDRQKLQLHNVKKLTSELLEYFRLCRCLIILDNTESILAGGECAGIYREGYENYGEFFQHIGEVSHQSCLVLTSREKPQEIAISEGSHLPIRSLGLGGLLTEDAKAVLTTTGLTGSEDEFSQLIACYRGNPLALKIVSTSVYEIFDQDISAFLAQGTVVSSGIRHLLDQHFQRLTGLEKQIMYWLAIDREWVTLAELKANIVPPVSPTYLLEALESLIRRSLIEQRTGSFTQQPVVMEYISDRLIAQVCKEISEEWESRETEEEESTPPRPTPLFKTHALLKAHAQDYVREAQVQLILKPVINELLFKLGTKKNIETRLAQILDTQRSRNSAMSAMEEERSPLESGYIGGNVLNLLAEMGTDLAGWDFSHLTIRQACLQKVNLHHVDFAYSDLSQSLFTQTFGSILTVAFSPNGELLATGEANGEIYLWRVANSQLLTICVGHTGWVWAVAFSPDGQTLASGSADQTVRLWEVSTGQNLGILNAHTDSIWSVAFSPDGKTLASGSHDQTVKIWDLNSRQNTQTLQAHTNWVWSVAFSPDGKTLASGSTDETIRLWDIATGENTKTFLAHTNAVRTVAFSPDGKILASGGHDRLVKLWHVSTGEVLATLQGHTNRVLSIAFSPNSKILASASLDRTVWLWDTSTGTNLRVLHGHSNSIWSVAFSPNGKILASGSADQTVRLWDMATGKISKKLQGYSNSICTIAFSPDGKILASGSTDGYIRLWDRATGQKLRTLKGHSNVVWSVAFSPDGEILASGSHDQTVRLWQISTGQTIKTLQGHSNSVWSVAFSPDGKILASGSHDQTVKLWNISTGLAIATFLGHTNSICAVAWSPDGQTLASGSDDQTVKLWQVSTGQVRQTLQGHKSWIWSVAFSPDGQTLASGSLDQTVRLWDVHTGENRGILGEHSQLIRTVAFSPDGKTLASGSDDHKIRLWDIAHPATPKILQGHTNWVWSLVFSPDGEVIASSSEDETIKLWSVDSGECLQTLKPEKPYEGMNITGVVGISEVLRSTLKTLGAVE